MTLLRKRMIQDMVLSGLAESTQKSYIDAVLGLAKHYWRSPDLLSEEEVRSYLVGLKERGVARGTFNTNHYGIQFLFYRTLNRDWPLFTKKKFVPPNRSACRSPLAMPRYASCWAMSGIRSTRPVLRSCMLVGCG